jgi:hypothetical protein
MVMRSSISSVWPSIDDNGRNCGKPWATNNAANIYSRVCRYQLFHQFWFPEVKFEVEYILPPIKPLSREGMQSSQTVMAKWIGEQPIPRKRRHIEL